MPVGQALGSVKQKSPVSHTFPDLHGWSFAPAGSQQLIMLFGQAPGLVTQESPVSQTFPKFPDLHG
jgi:hypothetical protein